MPHTKIPQIFEEHLLCVCSGADGVRKGRTKMKKVESLCLGHRNRALSALPFQPRRNIFGFLFLIYSLSVVPPYILSAMWSLLPPLPLIQCTLLSTFLLSSVCWLSLDFHVKRLYLSLSFSLSLLFTSFLLNIRSILFFCNYNYFS